MCGGGRPSPARVGAGRGGEGATGRCGPMRDAMSKAFSRTGSQASQPAQCSEPECATCGAANLPHPSAHAAARPPARLPHLPTSPPTSTHNAAPAPHGMRARPPARPPDRPPAQQHPHRSTLSTTPHTSVDSRVRGPSPTLHVNWGVWVLRSQNRTCGESR